MYIKNTIIFSALALFLVGCPKPNENLKNKLEECKNSKETLNEEISQCRGAADSIQTQKARVENELKRVCEEVKKRETMYTPTNDTVTTGPAYKKLGCNEDIEIRIYKDDWEFNLMYLKYRVKGNLRYSDPLYLNNSDKRDRNALLIQHEELNNNYLVWLKSCNEEDKTCEVECSRLVHNKEVRCEP